MHGFATLPAVNPLKKIAFHVSLFNCH
jgi:hypothetical protein